MVGRELSAFPVDDSSSREVIGGECNTNFVSRNDPDVMLSHLSGQVCQNDVSVLQFHSEHGVRQ